MSGNVIITKTIIWRKYSHHPGPQIEGPSNNIQTPGYFPTQLEGIRPYFLFVYRLG